MTEINNLASKLAKLALAKANVNKDASSSSIESSSNDLITKTSGLDLSTIDKSLLSEENKGLLEKLQNGDLNDPNSAAGEESAPKTVFDSKQEFIKFFGLDPTSDDYTKKIIDAQQYMKDNNIESVTIDEESYNIYTDEDIANGAITTTDANDLILNTTNTTNISAGAGSNFIFSNAYSEKITTGDGDDAIILGKNSGDTDISDGNGKDFVFISSEGENDINVGIEGSDVIYKETSGSGDANFLFGDADETNIHVKNTTNGYTAEVTYYKTDLPNNSLKIVNDNMDTDGNQIISDSEFYADAYAILGSPESDITPDPITPDPITPDPTTPNKGHITPKPITPDPTTPNKGHITPDPILGGSGGGDLIIKTVAPTKNNIRYYKKN